MSYASSSQHHYALASALPFISAEFSMDTTHDTGGASSLPQLGRSVTIDRAAEILGVSRRTVYYRISEGVLQTIRTRGGSQRVVVDSLPVPQQH